MMSRLVSVDPVLDIGNLHSRGFLEGLYTVVCISFLHVLY
jgi:hypothetical protein